MYTLYANERDWIFAGNIIPRTPAQSWNTGERRVPIFFLSVCLDMQAGNFTFARQSSGSRANWPACSCELSTRGARCVPTGHECVRPLAATVCYFAAGNTAISESSRSLSNHSNRSSPPNRGIRNRRAVAHRSSSSVPDPDFHANNAITRRGIMLDCRADCSLSLPLSSRAA